jgi:hypothetical protein
MFAVFEAAFEKELHTEADAEQRLAGAFFHNDLPQTGFAQFERRVTERPDTGKENTVRLPDHVRVGSEDGIRADVFKGTAEGKNIPDAVVNNCYHRFLHWIK